MNTVAVVAILAAPLGIDDTPSTPGPCDEACRDALPAHGDGIAAQYLTLLEMALVGTLTDEAGQCEIWPPGSCNKTWPFEAYKRSSGLDWPPYGHTMIGHKRLRNVREAIESVVANRVDGSFAELGVWRGGTCIYARALLDLLGQRHRRVHLFDVFGTLSGYGGNAAFLRVSKEQVARNFVKYGYGDELRAGRVVMHKGLFEQTLRRFRRVWERERFAVLRIDANYYSSYQHALYHLWDRVSVGGIVIFDDIYGSKLVKQAWEDFAADTGLSATAAHVHKIDWTGGWIRKNASTPVNWARFRSPEQIVARLTELGYPDPSKGFSSNKQFLKAIKSRSSRAHDEKAGAGLGLGDTEVRERP